MPRSARNSTIAWTPAYLDDASAGQVEVSPWPDRTGWSEP
jgi:hypothetical protein